MILKSSLTRLSRVFENSAPEQNILAQDFDIPIFTS